MRYSIGIIVALGFSTVAHAQVYYGAAPTVVFDKTYTLSGTTHTIELKDLKGFGPGPADTYLYVFKQVGATWQLAAYDDDGAGSLASKVTNVNTGTILSIVVASYNASRHGTCDVWIDGVKKEDDVAFGGVRLSLPSWSNGSYPWTPPDRITTVGDPSYSGLNPISDARLFVFGPVGSPLQYDDDSHLAMQSAVTLNNSCSGSCTVLVAPYSGYAGGYVMVVHSKGSDGDADGDGVPTSVEAALGSSDTNVDSDGDHLNDYWETFGIPPVTNSSPGPSPLPTLAGVDAGLELHALGATPGTKDIFIAAIGFRGQQPTDPWSGITEEQRNWLRASFTDDTAYSGVTYNVNFLIDLNASPRKYLGVLTCAYTQSSPSDWISMTEMRDQYTGYFPHSKLIAHFVGFGWPNTTGLYPKYYDPNAQGYLLGQPDGCNLAGIKGEATQGDSLSVIFTNFPPPSGSSTRGAIMHEFGHNFGFWHDTGNNTWPKSVMNYEYVLPTGGGFADGSGGTHWSYSKGAGPACTGGQSCYTDNCDCNEWSVLQHPLPVCGDGQCEGIENVGVCCGECPCY